MSFSRFKCILHNLISIRKVFVEKHFKICVFHICSLYARNHEPRQKWVTLLPQDVRAHPILRSMFKIEQTMIGCVLVQRFNGNKIH